MARVFMCFCVSLQPRFLCNQDKAVRSGASASIEQRVCVFCLRTFVDVRGSFSDSGTGSSSARVASLNKMFVFFGLGASRFYRCLGVPFWSTKSTKKGKIGKHPHSRRQAYRPQPLLAPRRRQRGRSCSYSPLSCFQSGPYFAILESKVNQTCFEK